MATKAQEIYEEIERRIAAGTDKADALKQLAEETGRPYDSLRGSYYTHKRKLESGEGVKPSRTRRRETTPDDALADAQAACRAGGRINRPRGRGRRGARHTGKARPKLRPSRPVQPSVSRPSPSVWRH